MDGRVLILSSIGGEHALDPRRYSLDFEAAGIDDSLHDGWIHSPSPGFSAARCREDRPSPNASAR